MGPILNITLIRKVEIGAMDKECPHCNALKFKNEPAGMCVARQEKCNYRKLKHRLNH